MICATPGRRFLSCLFGSELDAHGNEFLECFLSCLFGSEQQNSRSQKLGYFLSCLFGSERHGFM